MKKETWRKNEAEAVRRFWTLGNFSRCAVDQCNRRGAEVHHPFGRTKEPWCSSRVVCMLLCMEHHREVTGQIGSGLNVKLRNQLRLGAVESLRRRVQADLEAKGSRALLFFDQDGTEWPATRRFEYVCEVADLNGIAPPFWRGDSGGR